MTKVGNDDTLELIPRAIGKGVEMSDRNARSVTFDTNVLNVLISNEKRIADSEASSLDQLRGLIETQKVMACCCETIFSIEAIATKQRPNHFRNNNLKVVFGPRDAPRADGLLPLMSLSANNENHPGLADKWADFVQQASVLEILIIRATRLGMPQPKEIGVELKYAPEPLDGRAGREKRFVEIVTFIESQGLGKMCFESALANHGVSTDKQIWKAAAEWADADTIASHYSYKNDILCTRDHGKSKGNSVFGERMRREFASRFGIRFLGVAETLREIRR